MSTRRMKWLANTCMALLFYDAVVGAFSLWNVLEQMALISTEGGSRFFLETAIGELLARARLIAWLDRAGVVATAAVFIPFFATMYSRLPAPRQMRWRFLGWFVPIANLYVPFRLAKEIDAQGEAEQPSWAVFVWWVAWLCSRLLGMLTHMASSGGSVQQELQLDAVSSGTSVLAALAAIWLVRKWSGRPSASEGPQ